MMGTLKQVVKREVVKKRKNIIKPFPNVKMKKKKGVRFLNKKNDRCEMSKLKEKNERLKEENQRLKEEIEIRNNTRLQKEINNSLKEIREGKCIVI